MSRVDGPARCMPAAMTAIPPGCSASRIPRGTATSPARLCHLPAGRGDGGGGRVMVDEGLFERFPMEAVFGMHNWPGTPDGTFSVRAGPTMAATDTRVVIKRQGRARCHAASRHRPGGWSRAQIVTALQTIVARKVEPTEPAVTTIALIHAGDDQRDPREAVTPERHRPAWSRRRCGTCSEREFLEIASRPRAPPSAPRPGRCSTAATPATCERGPDSHGCMSVAAASQHRPARPKGGRKCPSRPWAARISPSC